MLSDLLLRGLPLPVRLLALAGVLFVLGVFGSVAVAATRLAVAPDHAVPVDSLRPAVGLRGPSVLPARRAAQRQPAAVDPGSLARGVHRHRRPPAPQPQAIVPVAPTPAQPLPAESAAPEVPRPLPPVAKGAPPPLGLPEGEPAPPVEPPGEEPAPEEPPAEEPGPEEPGAEEPPVEEPPAEEPPAEEPPAEEPGPPSEQPTFLGDTIRSFLINNSEPGAVTEVPDPAGSGQTVFKFTVGDDDKTQGSTPNPRAELIARPRIENGDEFWWSTKFFLPADFPAATPGFVTLMQVFGPPDSGSPPFHLELNNGVVKWQRNATYDFDVPWQMPQVSNRWVTVMVHERFARDGWVEMWIDGDQVTFFAGGSSNPNGVAPTARLQMETMDSSNSGGSNSVYLQQYRLKGMYPTLVTYEGPLLIGPTRASVGG